MGSIDPQLSNGHSGKTNGIHVNGTTNGDVSEATMPIAIIGMSCRFPGDATSPEKLWQLCADSRSAWSEIPESRFNQKSFYHPLGVKNGTNNVRGAHFLTEDVTLFDASFFSFSSEVASTMDPQLRLQLECTFEAMESAGIPIEKIAGTSTSVYAGLFFNDHHDHFMRDPDTVPRYHLTGNGSAMMSNRISHFFDLTGPSTTVDTGCSTSHTALHLACTGLRAGDSTMSIVSGVNIMLNPDMFAVMTSLGILSVDGRSYAFDSRATGYGRGEGVATIIIKPLKDALRDGDPIRAVIRETLLNQDGKTPTITSPSQTAQEDLVRQCYENAGLDPSKTTYIEAHGTGTKTGDPIETGAMSKIFCADRDEDKPVLIASVKTNIGHTEAASGLAGVIKVAMSFEKGLIPPSHLFKTPNPNIPFQKWKLKVPQALTPWPAGEIRRASINSFGYGGTNGHVILDDPSYYRPHANGSNVSSPVEKRQIFTLSAKDEGSAKTMVANLKSYLEKPRDEPESEFLDNLAYTLGQRRSRFPWVSSVAARSVKELVTALGTSDAKPTRSSGNPPRLGFVFTGQGAQWHAMGRELMTAYPVFMDALTEADTCLHALGAPWSLIAELSRDEASTRVNQPEFSLPLCTAIQCCLVRLLRSWGINPTGVTGHSSGEVSAAFAAGAVDMKSAMAIVYLRGALTTGMQDSKTPGGGMLAVGLGRKEAEEVMAELKSGLVVTACVNSPSSTTAAGDLAAIDEMERILVARKVFARRVKADAAYHSHHMQPIAPAYLEFMQKTGLFKGSFGDIIYSSPATGGRISSALDLTPDHWVYNMLQPVLFDDSLRNLCIDRSVVGDKEPERCVDMLIEIGPHSALAGPIRQILQSSELQKLGIQYGSALVRGTDAVQTMQALACNLLGKGYPVDLAAVNFPRAQAGLQVVHNLPSYPWNHQTSHWVEPRANRVYRKRQYPTHDLLGDPAVGSSAMAPVWRHFVKTTEVPWVRDHVVQASIVYPGAGYLCMAIEAAKQLSQSAEKVPTGYKLRDIEISNALVVPEGPDGVEVHLSFRDCSKDKSLGSQAWQEFHVFSLTKEEVPIIHCKGFIQVAYGAGNNTSWSPVSAASLFEATKCTESMDPNEVYASLQSVGINHGPIFQNLKTISAGHHCSVSTFVIADTAAVMPNNFEHEHVVHPTTLDSLLQAAYSTLPRSGKGNAMIPQTIKSMFVAHDMAKSPGQVYNTYSTLNQMEAQGFNATIAATSSKPSANSVPEIEFTGVHFQSLGDSFSQDTPGESSKLCSTVHWDNALSTMSVPAIIEPMKFPQDLVETNLILDMKRLSWLFFEHALQSLTAADIKNLAPHHKSLHGWMAIQVKLGKLNTLGPQSSQWANITFEERSALFERVRTASVNGELICRIGTHLVDILRGSIAPLDLMLQDKLLYKYYEGALRYDRLHLQVNRLVKLLAHENPRAKVIEIGAGTGGCTRTVLDAFGRDAATLAPRVAQYDYTDISPAFFQDAREQFSAWGNIITYKKLDIEEDPEEQGYESGTYDVVVACLVLHATKALDRTMTHVRKLLKPGGKLIMVENTRDAFDVQLVFGVLPGWWLSIEEDRKLSPSYSGDQWDILLKRTGFTGVDAEVRDCESEQNYAMSTMLSTATGVPSANFSQDVVLIHNNSSLPATWIGKLQSAMKRLTGAVPQIASLESAEAHGKTCIFLSEIEESLLSNLNKLQYSALRTILTTASGVLWVSRGGAVQCEQPQFGIITGLLRTLRCEDSTKRYVTLDLDASRSPFTPEDTDAILRVFKSTFDYSKELDGLDFEFAERDSLIQVPRVYEDVAETDAASAHPTEPLPELQPYYQAGSDHCLEITSPGTLDSLVFKDHPRLAILPEDFVEIEPKAFGLNFRDLMAALGQMKTRMMGYECSGIVTRIGPGATHDLKVGDRVCALTRGDYANWISLHSTSVARIPDAMTFEVAASIPMVFITAYAGLYDHARLQKGEKVLIHAATGGVGQAAVILAKLAGAEIFVTVGTQEKRDFVTKTYGIPADHIFSSRDSSFATNIMQATKGKGVDVVLNSLAGQLLQDSLNCIAAFGRFVEIGKRDLEINSQLSMGPFARCVTFSHIDLVELGYHKGADVARILSSVLHLFDNGSIGPVSPINVYPISQLEKAFRLMQSGKHTGKIIIRPEADDMVKVVPSARSVKLLPDASYLVIGGLGGIGRSICKRLVERGAKNLILLSRNAESSQASAKTFLDELKDAGCKVSVRSCDIADKDNLAKVIAGCTQDMPVIRGVIQAAMVLKDSIFEQMTFEDWTAATRPKIQGSWNLHNQFSSTLDFFVILSSFVGFGGNSSQANYGAGGSFEDALARHRTAQGLPALSIDLGMVASVGYVAENRGVAERLARMGYIAIQEDEVLRLIESGIAYPKRELHSCQLVTGIPTGADADWGKASWRFEPRFSGLRQTQSSALSSNASTEGVIDVKSQIVNATTFAEVTGFICAAIVKKLSEMFMIPETEIAQDAPMSKYGVDSLVAVELRNWLVSTAATETSIFDVMQSSSLIALAEKAALKSKFVEKGLLPVA